MPQSLNLKANEPLRVPLFAGVLENAGLAARHCLPETVALRETGKQCCDAARHNLLAGKQWHTAHVLSM